MFLTSLTSVTGLPDPQTLVAGGEDSGNMKEIIMKLGDNGKHFRDNVLALYHASYSDSRAVMAAACDLSQPEAVAVVGGDDGRRGSGLGHSTPTVAAGEGVRSTRRSSSIAATLKRPPGTIESKAEEDVPVRFSEHGMVYRSILFPRVLLSLFRWSATVVRRVVHAVYLLGQPRDADVVTESKGHDLLRQAEEMESGGKGTVSPSLLQPPYPATRMDVDLNPHIQFGGDQEFHLRGEWDGRHWPLVLQFL